ncbi:PAS domain S-box protein [Fictibacillus barbaricus]|uniref:PAS domain S-box protein n=1 Tax=Fictibacillus barbaricus TaxID=182136 RepID=UPI0016642F15|nr:PAS domain S-box protein [Fictibacillus barbaricus]GGB46726.1 sporulation kinase E [Fictibacillus barbaricus]
MRETPFELQNKKQLLRTFYEAVNNGIIVIEPSGKMIFANTIACSLLGLAEVEIEDRFFYNLPFNVIDKHNHNISLQDVYLEWAKQTQKTDPLELGLQCKETGNIQYVLAAAAPIFDGFDRLEQIVITLTDNQKLMNNEKELSRSRERFYSLVDSMEDTVFTLDQNLIHTGIYGKWMEKHQVKPSYFLGKTIREVFGDDIAEGQEKACRLVLQGRSQIYEWGNVRNGERYYYQAILSPIKNDQGQVEGIVGVSRDITEGKRMEIGLRESEERFRQFAENAKDVFWMKDYETRKLLYVSKAYEHIWELEDSETFVSVFDEVHPEDNESVQEFIKSIAQGESQIEYRIQGKNKKVRWIRTRAFPITNDQEEIYRIAGISEDITDLKEKEELLRKSDKLTVVGELAAGIAHEIRNPLTSIKGFVQLMKPDMEDLHSEIILSEMDRIESIINEFLVLAKPHQETVFQQRSVNDFIRQTITLLDSEANLNNVQFDTHLRYVPNILCEGNQIKQVIINVIKNAIESMLNGGTIFVETGIHDEGYVFIKITDQGEGISEERLAKLGEPFYSNKEKGIGLGLMVSLKIIENHHGNITFESILGIGTTVTILLPNKLLP